MFRIDSIKFHNFRNIFDSEVKLSENTRSYFKNGLGGAVVGIYGQNSTSKSSVGYALNLFQELCDGFNFAVFHNINDDFGINDDYMMLEYKFSYFDNLVSNKLQGLTLKFIFKRKSEEEFYIFKEKITFHTDLKQRPISLELNRTDSLISEESIKDLNKIGNFFNMTSVELIQCLTNCVNKNKSLFLSYDFISKIAEQERKHNEEFKYLLSFCVKIMTNMVVIMQDSYCMSISNVLFPCYGGDVAPADYFKKNQNGFIELNEDQKKEVDKVIDKSNKFLKKIIKNFRVEFVCNKVPGENGEINYLGKLKSIKKKGMISFENESEGIKRMFFIAAAISRSLSEKDFIIFVDEFDEGIFEVLLGEILNKIYEYCIGQFIFTSHNLRPLEILPFTNFVFSTINPKNRYVFFTGVKTSNNFRDLYIRRIMYGMPGDEFTSLVTESDILDGLINASR